MTKLEDCCFHVCWSEEQRMYVGVCQEYGSLVAMNKTADEALASIHALVAHEHQRKMMRVENHRFHIESIP